MNCPILVEDSFPTNLQQPLLPIDINYKVNGGKQKDKRFLLKSWQYQVTGYEKEDRL